VRDIDIGRPSAPRARGRKHVLKIVLRFAAEYNLTSAAAEEDPKEIYEESLEVYNREAHVIADKIIC
jgi:hypothetical protein